VSRNLDIDPKSLKSWVALYNAGTLKGTLGITKLTPDQLRIRELERELAIAREKRDILKKATAYFHAQSCRFSGLDWRG
jgi:transposase